MTVREWWNGQSFWKKGAYIGLILFLCLLLISIIMAFTIDSDMSGLALLLPFFLFKLIPGLKTLSVPPPIALLVSFALYYGCGLLIALMLEKSRKREL